MVKQKKGRPVGSGIPKAQIQAYIPIPLRKEFDRAILKRQIAKDKLGLNYFKTDGIKEAISLYVDKYS